MLGFSSGMLQYIRVLYIIYWSRHGVFVGTKWLGKCDNKINACAQKTIERVWRCGLKPAIMKCGVFNFHPTWKLIPWKAIQPENFLGSKFQRTPSRLVPSVGCSSHGKSTAGKGPPPKQGKGVPKKVLQIIGSFNQAIKQRINSSRQALWSIGVLMKPSLQRRPPCLWVGAYQCGDPVGHGKLYRNWSANVGAAEIGIGTIFYSYS